MTNPRTSTALHHLDIHDPPDPRWDWAIARIEPSGRIRLPDAARTVLGAIVVTTPVVVLARGDALLVRPAPNEGRRRTLDARGRLYVPHWLRTHPTLVVGTLTADRVTVLAPATLLDPLGDVLLGGRR